MNLKESVAGFGSFGLSRKQNFIMSTSSDFKAQPFLGIGDPRTVEYRRFVENQIQKVQFTPFFSAQGFVLPDIAADLQLMEGLGNRDRASYVYSQSPAAEER